MLVEVARHLRRLDFDAVLIGNAAAALQGAPVTTVDRDFLFRKTPRNIGKIKTLARALGAVVMRPYYPVSDLFRIVRDADGLQLDFMATIHGPCSFAGVRDRASDVDVDGVVIRVASFHDIPEVSALLQRRFKLVPSERRTNFLRKRVGICRTAL